MHSYIKRLGFFVAGAFLVTAGVLFFFQVILKPQGAVAASAQQISLPFTYFFRIDGRVHESEHMDLSSSPYWWVNSGGIMYLENGVGKTSQNNMYYRSWRDAYARSNPTDTENGLKPQNIFRLLFRTKWQNIATSVTYTINKYNTTNSPQRMSGNAILLFNRYQDADNLYYAGLRVDGAAVIKKKKNGTYYTLAYKKILPGQYNRNSNPNLLPIDKEIGLKTEVKNLSGGRVSIKLYADIGKTGTWTLVAETIDDGKSYGGAALTEAGHPGLRTDFMDVEFDNFSINGI